MSKILVVEPRKILQQAIRLALCPDHEVQLDDESIGHRTFDNKKL